RALGSGAFGGLGGVLQGPAGILGRFMCRGLRRGRGRLAGLCSFGGRRGLGSDGLDRRRRGRRSGFGLRGFGLRGLSGLSRLGRGARGHQQGRDAAETAQGTSRSSADVVHLAHSPSKYKPSKKRESAESGDWASRSVTDARPELPSVPCSTRAARPDPPRRMSCTRLTPSRTLNAVGCRSVSSTLESSPLPSRYAHRRPPSGATVTSKPCCRVRMGNVCRFSSSRMKKRSAFSLERSFK